MSLAQGKGLKLLYPPPIYGVGYITYQKLAYMNLLSDI